MLQTVGKHKNGCSRNAFCVQEGYIKLEFEKLFSDWLTLDRVYFPYLRHSFVLLHSLKRVSLASRS